MRFFKRFFVMIILALFVLSAAQLHCFAADTVISAERKSVDAGEQNVSIALTLSGNSGIAGAMVFVQYDSALTLTKVERGSALVGLAFTAGGDLTANPIRLIWDGLDADNTNGTLATLIFTVPQRPGTYQIRPTIQKGDLYDGELNDISVTLASGEIKVTDTDQPSSSTSSASATQTAQPVTYTDVAPTAWYRDAVSYVQQKGLMSGTGDNTFAPESTMTRAMLMTVLARYAGTDTGGGATWYEKGMSWAKANGVSDGTNPSGSITREQLVTMLYRYQKSPAVSGELSFSDAGSVSAWASDAMRWAVAKGIVTGMNDGTLAPQQTATRAQVATILMRFCKLDQ